MCCSTFVGPGSGKEKIKKRSSTHFFLWELQEKHDFVKTVTIFQNFGKTTTKQTLFKHHCWTSSYLIVSRQRIYCNKIFVTLNVHNVSHRHWPVNVMDGLFCHHYFSHAWGDKEKFFLQKRSQQRQHTSWETDMTLQENLCWKYTKTLKSGKRGKLLQNFMLKCKQNNHSFS